VQFKMASELGVDRRGFASILQKDTRSFSCNSVKCQPIFKLFTADFYGNMV